MSAHPSDLWDACAAGIAGSPHVRVMHDGRYSRRRRDLGKRPEGPATVPTYDDAGMTRCIVADFDAGRCAEPGAVAGDARNFAAYIEQCGGQVVVDRSITGGRHVYVPLQRPLPLRLVRQLMAGLVARYRTLDAAPMLNAKTGCIRPPGSAHPRGGHQELLTPIEDARRVFADRNPPTVWERICATIGPVNPGPAPRGLLHAASQPHRPGTRVPLSPLYAEIATTGTYGARYKSPSEARQAVITSAYQRGWTLPEVIEEMDKGRRWPGMAQFYGRYAPKDRASALLRDWRKSASFADGSSHTAKCHTSRTTHTPPHMLTGRKFVRAWWTAMRATETSRYADRPGQSSRLVLRALAYAADVRGTRYPKVGVRALALGSGLDHGTVARVLRRLREEADPLIVLVDGDRGHGNADIYELRIPDGHKDIAEKKRWRAGKIEPIHPVFAQLGATAALVYDALGEHRDPIDTVQHVATAAALGDDAARTALYALAAYELAVHTAEGWARGPGNLDAVADILGVAQWHQERIERFRFQRAAWRARLAKIAGDKAARGHELVVELDEIPIPPEPEEDDHGETTIETLERILGATLVPV